MPGMVRSMRKNKILLNKKNPLRNYYLILFQTIKENNILVWRLLLFFFLLPRTLYVDSNS